MDAPHNTRCILSLVLLLTGYTVLQSQGRLLFHYSKRFLPTVIFKVLLYDKVFLFTRIIFTDSNKFFPKANLSSIISSYIVRIVFHFPLQYRSSKKITRTPQSITIATQTPNTPIPKYFPKI